jgi:hypothetical protein
MKVSDLSASGGLMQNSGNYGRQLFVEENFVSPKTEGSEK